MPFFRIGPELHYFAHVPKCAGTSIEDYLRTRFGSLAFLDRRHNRQPEGERWTRSSPQHIPAEALARMVPEDWISSSFAVVRDPISRLRSAFSHQAQQRRSVDAGMTINEWFEESVASAVDKPFMLDNHLRSQSDMVPAQSTVFKLENGLDHVVRHLDRLAGESAYGSSIPVRNQSANNPTIEPERLLLTADTLLAVGEYYRADFDRFNYSFDPRQEDPTRPPTPASTSASRGGQLPRLLRGLGRSTEPG